MLCSARRKSDGKPVVDGCGCLVARSQQQQQLRAGEAHGCCRVVGWGVNPLMHAVLPQGACDGVRGGEGRSDQCRCDLGGLRDSSRQKYHHRGASPLSLVPLAAAAAGCCWCRWLLLLLLLSALLRRRHSCCCRYFAAHTPALPRSTPLQCHDGSSPSDADPCSGWWRQRTPSDMTPWCLAIIEATAAGPVAK